MRGIVKVFDGKKGYGFIVGEDGKEYLVHFTSIKGPIGAIAQNTAVEFEPVETPKGLQAANVRPSVGP